MDSLLHAITTAARFVALAAFVIAAVSAWRMTQYRNDDVPLWRLITNGRLFYGGESFKPEGDRHRRRFLAAALLFFAAIIAGAVSGIVLASRHT